MKDNVIICGDTIEELKKLPSSSIDFCFADPPYFMQIDENKKLYRVEGTEYDGCDDEWDKFPSMDAYKEWTSKWISEIYRVLKKDGTFCVISGMQSIYEIGNIMRDIGFWVINDIIWKKSNPTPNFSGSRLNNSHETMIWAAKSKKSHFTFNYKTGKFLNDGKQMGSIWTFPVCSGNERLKDDNGNKLHTTQKPEALLYRIIVLFTHLGDLVLDPFGGTMTTPSIAKRTGRKYIAIERDEKYVKYGTERVNNEIEKIGDIERAIADIKPEKVPFDELVKENYLTIGEQFYNNKKEEAVLVNDRGELNYNGTTKSMHEIAGKMSGLSRRLNAYDKLFVKRDGEYISLGEIRNRYRSAHFK